MAVVEKNLYIHGGMSGPTFHKDMHVVNIVDFRFVLLNVVMLLWCLISREVVPFFIIVVVHPHVAVVVDTWYRCFSLIFSIRQQVG